MQKSPSTSAAQVHQPKAQQMFDSMQRVFECRDKPITESYLDDFYKHDLSSVAGQFAPNSRYLWLQHPHGTHFGRIGVLPGDDTYMHGVLQAYQTAFAPERMELHLIETDQLGAARMRKLTFSEGFTACLRHDYTAKGDRLYASVTHKSGADSIGSITIKQYAEGPGIYGSDLSITTRGGLPREHLIALTQIGYRMASRATGSLFSKVGSLTIDGVPVDDAIPSLDIAKPVPGSFKAPVSDFRPSNDTPRSRPKLR